MNIQMSYTEPQNRLEKSSKIQSNHKQHRSIVWILWGSSDLPVAPDGDWVMSKVLFFDTEKAPATQCKPTPQQQCKPCKLISLCPHRTTVSPHPLLLFYISARFLSNLDFYSQLKIFSSTKMLFTLCSHRGYQADSVAGTCPMSNIKAVN